MNTQEIVTKFVEWLEESEGIFATENNIVQTAEPAENFVKNAHEYRRVRKEEMDGMAITVIEGHQLAKGDARKDLYVLVVEDGLSFVYC